MTATRLTFNRKTQTYTVTSPTKIVRNIPVKAQAIAVQMELRWGFADTNPVSFGDEEAR